MIPTAPDSLAALIRDTRSQHFTATDQASAMDALYLRLQEQEGPYTGPAMLDLWLRAAS